MPIVWKYPSCKIFPCIFNLLNSIMVVKIPNQMKYIALYNFKLCFVLMALDKLSRADFTFFYLFLYFLVSVNSFLDFKLSLLESWMVLFSFGIPLFYFWLFVCFFKSFLSKNQFDFLNWNFCVFFIRFDWYSFISSYLSS